MTPLKERRINITRAAVAAEWIRHDIALDRSVEAITKAKSRMEAVQAEIDAGGPHAAKLMGKLAKATAKWALMTEIHVLRYETWKLAHEELHAYDNPAAENLKGD